VTPAGTCCLVLHSHLPWLPGHGTWPVGEEWLYQAWSQSYLPVVELLCRLAEEGRQNLLTLGVTPVLAAQLDDPRTLRNMYTWLGLWQLRAEEAAMSRDVHLRELARHEFGRAGHAQEQFASTWCHGGTAVLRGLADAGVIELLGGPLTHPFLPLLDDRVARFALNAGLDDHVLSFGRRPAGIWAPECGYRPGLEELYETAGVERFVVDGPTLCTAGRSPAAAWTVAGTDVVAFGRDDELTRRVWAPDSGYPAGTHYRDFHTFDHASGFKPARVTMPDSPPEAKAPYDPEAAHAAALQDADDFAARVRVRLEQRAAELGRPGVAVVALDTELFGHWWHEGPVFLERLLRALPDVGVRLATLRGAADAGHVAGRVDPAPGSWGLSKDYHTWDGAAVADIAELNARVQRDLAARVDGADLGRSMRRPDMDELARQALLTLSSDWAFMITKNSAAGYARARAYGHAAAFDHVLTTRPQAPPRPFPHLDARLL
jgi:1,4-alpha-glucan branching enzyme